LSKNKKIILVDIFIRLILWVLAFLIMYLRKVNDRTEIYLYILAFMVITTFETIVLRLVFFNERKNIKFHLTLLPICMAMMVVSFVFADNIKSYPYAKTVILILLTVVCLWQMFILSKKHKIEEVKNDEQK